MSKTVGRGSGTSKATSVEQDALWLRDLEARLESLVYQASEAAADLGHRELALVLSAIARSTQRFAWLSEKANTSVVGHATRALADIDNKEAARDLRHGRLYAKRMKRRRPDDGHQPSTPIGIGRLDLIKALHAMPFWRRGLSPEKVGQAVYVNLHLCRAELALGDPDPKVKTRIVEELTRQFDIDAEDRVACVRAVLRGWGVARVDVQNWTKSARLI